MYSRATVPPALGKIGIPQTSVTMVIALTRIYLGVHWVTDIVGGLLIGTAAGVGAHLAYRRIMGSSDTHGRAGTPALSDPAPTMGA